MTTTSLFAFASTFTAQGPDGLSARAHDDKGTTKITAAGKGLARGSPG
jgi:hypothetical protein